MDDDDFQADLEAPGRAPEPTQWEERCNICGLQLAYVPAIGKYYLNHWKIEFAYPLGVLFVIHSSYLVCLFCHMPYVRFIGPALFWAMTVSNALFSISYFATVLTGPGYLPFSYPAPAKDYLSGLATTDEQAEYAKHQRLPPRCRYFRSARRIVIRPDHLCAWVSSFVGRKNHKLFVLFNFWGVTYISMFVYCSFRSLFELVTELDTTAALVNYAIVIVYTILGVSFLFLTGNFLQQNVRQITQNRTQFEIMRKLPPDTHRLYPWYRNWEEVFGPLRNWYLWLLPIPAFFGLDDYSLATHQVGEYKHI